jgi:hypothetical protein
LRVDCRHFGSLFQYYKATTWPLSKWGSSKGIWLGHCVVLKGSLGVTQSSPGKPPTRDPILEMIHFYDGVPTSNQTCIVNCYRRSSFYSLPTSECFEVTYQLHEKRGVGGRSRGGAQCWEGMLMGLLGVRSRGVGFNLNSRPLATPFRTML